MDTRKDEIKGNDVIFDTTAKKEINGTKIVNPKSPNQRQPYSAKTMRKKCKSRAAVEPVIGHVKYDCRMIKNYLKGNIGNDINAILAAAAYIYRGLLRKIKMQILYLYFNPAY